MGIVNTEVASWAVETRLMCARHDVRQVEIARRLGCSEQYVSQVLRADLRPIPISERQRGRIGQAIQEILEERACQ